MPRNSESRLGISVLS